MTQDRLGLLAELGDLLAGLDLRDGELERSLDRAAEAAAVIFGVDGAGLMLRLDDGALRLVGASSASARALEAAQLQLGAGPGFDATERAAVVAVEDLERSDRWPGLWERLAACGGRGVVRAPVTLPRGAGGQLHLFTPRARPRGG